MIHRINPTPKDKEHHIDENEQSKDNATSLDFSNVIVKKPWGYEYLSFENEHVAITLLHIVRKRKTSMHCHPKKKTTLVLLSGSATMYYLGGNIELKPMDSVIIGKGTFHSTEALNVLPMEPVSENGIWVMEIESPPIKTDLLRMEDKYGRAGASYEGKDKMVFDPKEIINFQSPEQNEVVKKSLPDCTITLRKRSFRSQEKRPNEDALISIVGKDPDVNSDNPFLQIGEASKFEEFYENTQNEDLSKYTMLIIEKGNMLVKLSDYIFSFIAGLGVKNVFAVSGGGAMHLVDSVGGNNDLNYIATHHEQAAAMAAEGNARVTGKPGVALFTSGPGGTNALTGVCGAWIDSIPSIFISGQVTSNTLIENTGLRQVGIQESDISELVKSVTKYAVTVKDPAKIKYHLQKAAYLALNGRPGPVWLDIPLDVQSKVVQVDELEEFVPDESATKKKHFILKAEVAETISLLKTSKRPVLICGYGIRLAKAETEFKSVVEKLGIPLISSWTSSDLIETDHELYIGRSGIMGDRAGNFTVQNSDLLLIIGSRMSIPQVGYNYKAFASHAKKIMVDVDDLEMKKPSINADLPINCDAKVFLAEFGKQLNTIGYVSAQKDWLQKCQNWKKKYPVVLPEYENNIDKVNSFYFVDLLSKKLKSDAVVVTDMGTSFTCTMQTFNVKAGQRFFTSSGHASMGFGLPGAIGACFANDRKQTICIAGDGALQMNIQELQTVVHYNLSITLFVLNNNGYLTIKLMQQNHFGRYTGSDPSSGVSCPDIVKVAGAYGIKTERINDQKELHEKIDGILSYSGSLVCEIMMPEDQPLIPRVSSLKKPDGSIISKPLEDLYPFLDRKEFAENMIVESVDVLK